MLKFSIAFCINLKTLNSDFNVCSSVNKLSVILGWNKIEAFSGKSFIWGHV